MHLVWAGFGFSWFGRFVGLGLFGLGCFNNVFEILDTVSAAGRLGKWAVVVVVGFPVGVAPARAAIGENDVV